jgi:amidase
MCPVIPISSHQDTIGPMCRSVADAAAVLSVIAGSDPLDNYTSAIPNVPDYTKALKKNALKGKRIGVPRNVFLDPKYTGLTQAELDAFEGALKTIAALGATIVDNADLPSAMEIVNSNNETVVLNVDFKVGSDENPIRAMLISAQDRTQRILRRPRLESIRSARPRGPHRVQ